MNKNSPVRRTPALKSQAAQAAKPIEIVKAVETFKPVIVAAAPTAVVAPVAAAFPTETVEKLRDGSVEVAVEAAETLAKSGDARVAAALISVLENGDGYCHVVTRSAAAMALGKFDSAESIAALIVAAKDEMAEVSREAILALGELKAVAAAPTLIEIAENASGFYLTTSRHAAVRSLGRIKAASAKAVLTAIAGDASEDAALTAAAREALGQI